jgi:hypothetical protein
VRRFSISRSMASSAVILLLILTSLAMVLILVPVLKKNYLYCNHSCHAF